MPHVGHAVWNGRQSLVAAIAVLCSVVTTVPVVPFVPLPTGQSQSTSYHRFPPPMSRRGRPATAPRATRFVVVAPRTTLFDDEFAGTTLDTSRWTVVANADTISVGGGVLTMGGAWAHHRITSIPTFAPTSDGSVTAQARIRLDGSYQKFGFNVNSPATPTGRDTTGPSSGFYFDTLDPTDPIHGGGGRVNHIHAIAWSVPASGVPADLLDTDIPVTWGTYHDFAVQWTPSSVIFSVDGRDVARVDHTFDGAHPLGLWNDRSGMMITDWVRVTAQGSDRSICPQTIVKSDNLICNPGFEAAVPSYSSGIPLPQSGANWLAFAPDFGHPGGRGVLAEVTTPVHNGLKSASVRTSENGTGAYYYQDLPSLKSDASYKLSFWVYPSSSAPGDQHVEFITGWDRGHGSTSGTNMIAFSAKGTTVDAWGQHVAGPALKPGGWRHVILRADTCTQTVHVDIDGHNTMTTARGTVPPSGEATLLVGQGAGTAPSTSQYYYDDFSLVTTSCSSHSATASGTWTFTGRMTTPRINNDLTLLPDGKALAVSAWGPNATPINTADVYDPRTGTWAATGKTIIDSQQSAVALLPNGKVLVAGGISLSTSSLLSKAELYDPRTNSWTETSSMLAAHATPGLLLRNGLVLVAGGCGATTTGVGGCTSLTTSAELYNPRTGTWVSTHPMLTPHYVGTFTLLPDGKVLAAGGCAHVGSNGSCTAIGATAELYDPHTGTWASTGSMTTRRFDDTATVLPDGQVLVGGGCDTAEHVYACSRSLATAELYDPGAGRWAAVASMATPRASHTATLLPTGHVLVAGGYTTCCGDSAPATTSSELYDPETNTWTATASLHEGRYAHAAVRLGNGRVLVAGGGTSGGNGSVLDSAELYQSSFNPSPSPSPSPVVGHCPEEETIGGWVFAPLSCQSSHRNGITHTKGNHFADVGVTPPQGLVLDHLPLVVHDIPVGPNGHLQIPRPYSFDALTFDINGFAVVAEGVHLRASGAVDIDLGQLYLPPSVFGGTCAPVTLHAIHRRVDGHLSGGQLVLATPLTAAVDGATLRIDDLSFSAAGLSAADASLALPRVFGSSTTVPERVLIGPDGTVTARSAPGRWPFSIANMRATARRVILDGQGISFEEVGGTIPVIGSSALQVSDNTLTFNGDHIVRGQTEVQPLLPSIHLGSAVSERLRTTLTIDVSAHRASYNFTGQGAFSLVASLNIPTKGQGTGGGSDNSSTGSPEGTTSGSSGDPGTSPGGKRRIKIGLGPIAGEIRLGASQEVGQPYTRDFHLGMDFHVSKAGGIGIPIADTPFLLTGVSAHLDLVNVKPDTIPNLIVTVSGDVVSDDKLLNTGNFVPPLLSGSLRGSVSTAGNIAIGGSASILGFANLSSGLCLRFDAGDDSVCSVAITQHPYPKTGQGIYAELAGNLNLPDPQTTPHTHLDLSAYGSITTQEVFDVVQPNRTPLPTPTPRPGPGPSGPAPIATPPPYILTPTPTAPPLPTTVAQRKFSLFADGQVNGVMQAGYFAHFFSVPIVPPCDLNLKNRVTIGTFERPGGELVEGIKAHVVAQSCGVGVNLQVFAQPPNQLNVGDDSYAVGPGGATGTNDSHPTALTLAAPATANERSIVTQPARAQATDRWVTIPPGASDTFISADWLAGSPSFVIVAPNGTRYNPPTTHAFSTIVAPGVVWFQTKNSQLLTAGATAGLALYVAHPQPGRWLVRARGIGPQTGLVLAATGAPLTPLIRITQPAPAHIVVAHPRLGAVLLAGTVLGGETRDVLSLFAIPIGGVKPAPGLPGLPIASFVPVRNGRFAFAWDARASLPVGRYHILAQLANPNEPNASSVSRGVVVIPRTLRAPQRVHGSLTIRGAGARKVGTLHVQWAPGDASTTGYDIWWRDATQARALWHHRTVGRVNGVVIGRLQPRRQYTVVVVGLDKAGDESDAVSVTFVTQPRRVVTPKRSQPRPKTTLGAVPDGLWPNSAHTTGASLVVRRSQNALSHDRIAVQIRHGHVRALHVLTTPHVPLPVGICTSVATSLDPQMRAFLTKEVPLPSDVPRPQWNRKVAPLDFVNGFTRADLQQFTQKSNKQPYDTPNKQADPSKGYMLAVQTPAREYGSFTIEGFSGLEYFGPLQYEDAASSHVDVTQFSKKTYDDYCLAVEANLCGKVGRSSGIVALLMPASLRTTSRGYYRDPSALPKNPAPDAVVDPDKKYGGQVNIDPPGINGNNGIRSQRGHLLGYVLGGSAIDPRNFATERDYANSPVQSQVEAAVKQALEGSSAPEPFVLYQVTPDYEGSCVVPYRIIIRAISVNNFAFSANLIQSYSSDIRQDSASEIAIVNARKIHGHWIVPGQDSTTQQCVPNGFQ